MRTIFLIPILFSILTGCENKEEEIKRKSHEEIINLQNETQIQIDSLTKEARKSAPCYQCTVINGGCLCSIPSEDQFYLVTKDESSHTIKEIKIKSKDNPTYLRKLYYACIEEISHNDTHNKDWRVCKIAVGKIK